MNSMKTIYPKPPWLRSVLCHEWWNMFYGGNKASQYGLALARHLASQSALNDPAK